MAQYGYRRAGVPSTTNSAAAYGSVMHHAISAGERAIATGTSPTLAKHIAQETFSHYWRIAPVCGPVPSDGWRPTHTYDSLPTKGLEALGQYFEQMAQRRGPVIPSRQGHADTG